MARLAFTQGLADAICEGLISGKSLRTICKQKGMPCQTTVFVWLTKHSSFAEQYAHARTAQAEAMLEEIIEIADDNQYDVRVKDDGTELVNHDHISRAKLRVDTRKWAMGKLAPKKYGEKVVNEHSGIDGQPIQVADMTEEKNKAIARELLKEV